MSGRKYLLSVAIISCICLFTVGVVGGSGGYELQAENPVDTPERNVTFESTELTIDHIGVFDYGDEIRAAASGPSSSHNVELRSATDPGRIIDIRRDGPNRTVSFDTVDNQLDPGTYVLLISDTVFQRAVPVVVSGYDISAELTESETADELTISATVTPTESSGQPDAVEAVVWNADTQKRVTLTQQSSTEYAQTVSVSEFDTSYEVYVSAIGDEPLYNSGSETEILGVENAAFGDDTGSDEQTEPDDGTVTPPAGENGETTTPAAGNNSTDIDGNETEPTHNGTDVDGNETEPTADDTDSVIQPNNESISDDTGETDQNDGTGEGGQTDDDTPLSVAVTVVALLSTALLAARQQ